MTPVASSSPLGPDWSQEERLALPASQDSLVATP